MLTGPRPDSPLVSSPPGFSALNKVLAPAFYEKDTLTGLSTGRIFDEQGNTFSVVADLSLGSRQTIPDGLSWITDTINGYDIYAAGFAATPTIYFDPQASDANGRGTFYKPYSTDLQLINRLRLESNNFTKHLGGTVIGFKRGSRLLGSLGMGTVKMNIAGVSGNPVWLVPYGDSEALPIISGGNVYALTGNASTGWESVSGASGLYKVATTSAEPDVWDQTADYHTQASNWGRLRKITAVANEAAAISALNAVGVGRSVWDSTNYILYIKPFAGTPDWTQVEVGNANNALNIRYMDIASSGYINVAGLHVRASRDSALSIAEPASLTYLTGDVPNCNIIGCKVGQAGYDNSASTYGSDAILMYGQRSANLLTNILVLGNRTYDVLNNPLEFAGINGGRAAFNVSDRKLLELWGNVSNLTYERNFTDSSGTTGQTTLKAIGSRGIWCPGYTNYGNQNRNPDVNTGNKYLYNIALNLTNCSIEHCGALGVAYGNTFTGVAHSGGGGGMIYVRDASGFPIQTSALTIKNNIIQTVTGNGGDWNIMSEGALATVVADHNLLKRSTSATSCGVSTLNGSNSAQNIASINSYNANGTNCSGGGSICEDPAINSVGYAVSTSGVFAAGAAVTGITYADYDYIYAATPAIGARYVGY